MELNDWENIHEYCMNKPCAYESRPFGEEPICYRVGGKIFAQLSTKENWFKITLKTNPGKAEIYRRIYPGVVVRGYHCPPVQQPHWNTIDLTRLDEEILWQMIDEAYDEVVKKLPKKDRERLPLLSKYHFVKTNGKDENFVKLCRKLDDQLNANVGEVTQKKQYDKFNGLEHIHDVFIVYEGDKAIGCGSYKAYDEESAELKRVFLDQCARGKGIAKELLRRLEADARINGFRYMVLETGAVLKDAIGLYTKSGYKVIPNYGPLTDLPQSICMRKKL